MSYKIILQSPKNVGAIVALSLGRLNKIGVVTAAKKRASVAATLALLRLTA